MKNISSDLNEFKEYLKTHSQSEAIIHFRVSKSTIYNWRVLCGLMNPPKAIIQNKEWFITYYPILDNKTIQGYLQLSEATIKTWARAWGLAKTKEHEANIRRYRRSKWKLSEESKQQIASKLRGVPQGPERSRKGIETKRRNGTMYSGEHHIWWNGGTTKTRFEDPRYKEWRDAVMKQSDYHCTWCGKTAREQRHGTGLDAHHIKGWKNHEDLRYEISNGMALCRDCHIQMHKIVGWS